MWKEAAVICAFYRQQQLNVKKDSSPSQPWSCSDLMETECNNDLDRALWWRQNLCLQYIPHPSLLQYSCQIRQMKNNELAMMKGITYACYIHTSSFFAPAPLLDSPTKYDTEGEEQWIRPGRRQRHTFACYIHTSSFFAPAPLLELSTLIKEKEDTLVIRAPSSTFCREKRERKYLINRHSFIILFERKYRVSEK